MHKLKPLFVALIFLIFCEGCKKDTITETVSSSSVLQADINGDTWRPDTLAANINFNAATRVKTFSCIGTANQKQVQFTINQPGSINTSGFPLAAYTVTANSNLSFVYNTQQKNSSGNYSFMPLGTVNQGSGFVTILSVDSVKKVISGTFSCTAIKDNYDANGNLQNVVVSEVSGGSFNNMPYTFTTN